MREIFGECLAAVRCSSLHNARQCFRTRSLALSTVLHYVDDEFVAAGVLCGGQWCLPVTPVGVMEEFARSVEAVTVCFVAVTRKALLGYKALLRRCFTYLQMCCKTNAVLCRLSISFVHLMPSSCDEGMGDRLGTLEDAFADMVLFVRSNDVAWHSVRDVFV